MPSSHDTILVETVRTRRARLHAALLSGELSRRRRVNDNLKRLVGSAVAAAVCCAGCVGFALVTSLTAAGNGHSPATPPAISATTPAAPVATAATGWGRP